MRDKKAFAKMVSKSSVNDIRLEYKGEKFKFSLYEELSINVEKINKELEEQPSYYGFLLLLQTRLLTIKEDLSREADKTYGRMYTKYKAKTNPQTNRGYSDDAAVQLSMSSEVYNNALKKAIKAKEDYNIINSCVRAFEQRSALIQTIAANRRKESN